MWLLSWTTTLQWQAEFVQCHCSPLRMIMVPVPPLTSGLLGVPRRQPRPELTVSGDGIYKTVNYDVKNKHSLRTKVLVR